MLGAIAGDVIGSVYEGSPLKTEDFPLFRRDSVFTDDTVLTVAVAHAILEDVDYAILLASVVYCVKRTSSEEPTSWSRIFSRVSFRDSSAILVNR